MGDFDEVSARGVSDGLDDESPSGPQLLPIIFALVAILLGGAALFFALSGQGQSDDLQTKLQAEIAAEIEKRTAIEERLRQAEDVISKVQRDEASLRTQVRGIATDAQNALNQVSGAMNSMRAQVSANAESIEEIVEQLNASRRPPAPAATESAQASDSISAQQAPDGYRQHAIQSGDTLGRLAREHGVSLNDILQANPDVQPNRLQIGTIILIPQSAPGD